MVRSEQDDPWSGINGRYREAQYTKIDRPDDMIVGDAVFEMISRSKVGIKKYKCTMAKSNMTVRQALIEARQEAMDQVVYLSKAIYEYDNETIPVSRPARCNRPANRGFWLEIPGVYYILAAWRNLISAVWSRQSCHSD